MTAQIASHSIELPDVEEEPIAYQHATYQSYTEIEPTGWLHQARRQGAPFIFSALRTNRRVQLTAAASSFGLILCVVGVAWLSLPHQAPTQPHVIAAPKSTADFARTPLPYSAPATQDASKTDPQKSSVAELLTLGGKAPKSPPTAMPQRPVVVAPHGQDRSAQASPQKPAAPLPPAAKPLATSTPIVTHRDGVDTAATLKSDPMTDGQQIQVLELVTKLGSTVRDQRAEISSLKAEVSALQQLTNHDLADFRRRLTYAEAERAVTEAGSAPDATKPPVSAPAKPSAVPAVQQAAAEDRQTHHYHIEAASTGLAMLSEAGSNSDTQFPVSPGTKLPGYGTVIEITQRGTAWLVKTDRGVIQ
jgi:hypothetical protein